MTPTLNSETAAAVLHQLRGINGSNSASGRSRRVSNALAMAASPSIPDVWLRRSD
jgi:hypothetical protein